MTISIFGLGYVGCVSLGCLSKMGYNVIGVDTNPIKVEQINNGLPTIVEKDIDTLIREAYLQKKIEATTDSARAILSTDVSIIAVGTPSSPTGHLNLDFIFRIADSFGECLQSKNTFHLIAIRSTVLPGTCDAVASIIEKKSGKKRVVDFEVVSNPEFLREGTAVNDYFNPPLTLIGSDNREAAVQFASLYKDLQAEVIISDLKTAEMMKYVNNTFHALKISFANEIGNICKSIGINPHTVMEIFCKDKNLNISPYYFKPGFAYGGSCLPKDLKGLQTLAHDLYLPTPLIDSINKTNDIQINRAVDMILKHYPKKLGFLGLSFKAGTDDLRNSPAVTVIETLIGKGFKITIYDKNVQLSRLTGTNKEFIESHIPHLAKLLVPDIKTLIDFSDVIIVNTKEQEYIDHLKECNGKTIIDLVYLGPEFLERPDYIGINW